MRAYNDGVAFRHLVPGTGNRVPDESTAFQIAPDDVVAPQYYVNGYEGPYPPRASVQNPKLLEDWFALCNPVGAAGGRIDFFDHEHWEVIDLYEMMAKAGAEHTLLDIFQGPTSWPP